METRLGVRAPLTALALLASIALANCGGGGSSGSTLPAATQPLPQGNVGGAGTTSASTPASAIPAGTTTSVTPGKATPPPSSTPVGGLKVLGFGGYQGNAFVSHTDGATLEYSEDAAILFSKPVGTGLHYTVTPQAPSSVYFDNYGATAQITIQKVPGVTYAITVATTTTSTDGTALAAPVTYHITTPANAAIPAPLRSTAGEPYRYGVLEHPFPFSLAGADADNQIALLAAAHVRFVRIDYCAAQNEPTKGTFDFTIEDQIAAKLAAVNITELPIVEQYCAPTWATLGAGYPAIFADPADYAAFAGAVAKHVATAFPKITRLELFNEPNLHGWWSHPDPASPYNDRSGAATATYMKAAYAAVKAANPAMTVVGPALSDGGWDTDPRKFLATMYASGCKTGACWDVLSVHNYRWYNPKFATVPTTFASYQNRFDIYKDLQGIAASNGDAGVHVMLTEWGFSNDPALAVAFDPKVQAQYVAIGFNLMLADPTVDGIVYVNMYNTATDFWGHTALTVPQTHAPLPGFSVYQQFAGY